MLDFWTPQMHFDEALCRLSCLGQSPDGRRRFLTPQDFMTIRNGRSAMKLLVADSHAIIAATDQHPTLLRLESAPDLVLFVPQDGCCTHYLVWTFTEAMSSGQREHLQRSLMQTGLVWPIPQDDYYLLPMPGVDGTQLWVQGTPQQADEETGMGAAHNNDWVASHPRPGL